MKQALESLIVILDHNAVPFCHYDNPGYGSRASDWMPLPRLQQAVAFAQERGVSPIYLLGQNAPPKAYARVLDQTPHTAVIPLALHKRIKDSIPVVQRRDVAALARLGGKRMESVILRLDRKALPDLAQLFGKVAKRAKRVNVCLSDVGQYSDQEREIYRSQLDAMQRGIVDCRKPTWATECNVLTDRLMLSEMNNCDAGIKHLTVAPNGRFYLCPGFYYQDPSDNVGTLRDGVTIRNDRLLSVDGAPICHCCDAYHCRRCLLLNKTLTLEINTPSSQQCRATHIEREASRVLRQALEEAGRLKDPGQTQPIAKLDYEDPFEMARNKLQGPPRNDTPQQDGPAQGVVAQDDDLLNRIVQIQQRLEEMGTTQLEILKELNLLKKERRGEA